MLEEVESIQTLDDRDNGRYASVMEPFFEKTKALAVFFVGIWWHQTPNPGTTGGMPTL